MIRDWTKPIVGTGLHYGETDASDPHLDVFDCGDGEHAEEIAEFFRERGWREGNRFNLPPTDCFQFGTATEIVGYMAIIEQEKRYPRFNSHGRRIYLLISRIGIGRAFQGLRDPDGYDTYGKEIFGELRRIAAERNLAGLYLSVRETNARARRCYESAGFKQDGPEYPSPLVPGNPILVRYRLELEVTAT